MNAIEFKVHVLNEEMRGPTLEAVVSRMKTNQSLKRIGAMCLRYVLTEILELN